MKNKLYILLLAVLFGSCDNFVDILPKGMNMPTTVDDFAKIMNSDLNINGGGKNWFYMTDDVFLPKEELQSASSADQNAYMWAPYIFSDMEHDKDWQASYQVLYYVNFVLDNILSAPEATQKKYDREETYGRALLHRAYIYWYLLTGYAPYCDETKATETLAIPMPLESDINNQYPRSTVDRVTQQILEDVNTALGLNGLSEWREINNWPCKAAGYALLSRIYLWQGKWSEAAENARKVLNIHDFLNDYNRMEMRDPANPAKGITGFQSNALFDPEVIFSKTAAWNFTGTVFSESLIASFEPYKDKDLRFRYLSSKQDRQGNPLNYLTRVNDESTFVGIRMSEVYLNRAEALVRMGGADNLAAARALLNSLRSKRYENPDTIDANMSQEELLNEVLRERRCEFRFTYMRWFDMKRLKVKVSHQGLNDETITLDGDSPRYTWAIPLDVMGYNSQLIQNER